jgi:hypothetical protein
LLSSSESAGNSIAFRLVAAALPFVFALWFVATARPPVTGDETHYLVYANSLVHGWGLDLERAYEPENRTWFYDGPLEKHADHYRGLSGPLATWHSIGLPLLIAPVVAVHPTVWAVRLLMVGLWALLAYHLIRLCCRLRGVSMTAASLGVIAVMAGAPVALYAGQIYPEVPGALLVILSIRICVSDLSYRLKAVLASIAAAALPWLAWRFVILSVALLVGFALHGIVRNLQKQSLARPALINAVKTASAIAIPAVLIGAGLMAVNQYLYGALTPTDAALSVTGIGAHHFSIDALYRESLGNLVSYRSGILAFNPSLIWGLVVLPLALRHWPRGIALYAMAAAIGYLAFTSYAGNAGFCPPARYVVVVLPLFGAVMAVGVARSSLLPRIILIALLGIALFTTWDAAHHLLKTYYADSSGIRLVARTARAWPVVYPETTTSGFTLSANDMLHTTGRSEHADGQPVFAAHEGRDNAGALVYGPTVALRPGRYEATAMVAGGSSPASTTPFTMDVLNAERLLAVSANASARPNTFAPFKLTFESDGPAPIDVRVTYTGSGDLAVSRVSVEPLEPLGEPRRPEDERWKAVVWLLAIAIGQLVVWKVKRQTRHSARL